MDSCRISFCIWFQLGRKGYIQGWGWRHFQCILIQRLVFHQQRYEPWNFERSKSTSRVSKNDERIFWASWNMVQSHCTSLVAQTIEQWGLRKYWRNGCYRWYPWFQLVRSQLELRWLHLRWANHPLNNSDLGIGLCNRVFYYKKRLLHHLGTLVFCLMDYLVNSYPSTSVTFRNITANKPGMKQVDIIFLFWEESKSTSAILSTWGK